jgi:hypothetical protein
MPCHFCPSFAPYGRTCSPAWRLTLAICDQISKHEAPAHRFKELDPGMKFLLWCPHWPPSTFFSHPPPALPQAYASQVLLQHLGALVSQLLS